MPSNDTTASPPQHVGSTAEFGVWQKIKTAPRDGRNLLRVHHDAIETWMLAQAGIVHTTGEKRMLAIAK